MIKSILLHLVKCSVILFLVLPGLNLSAENSHFDKSLCNQIADTFQLPKVFIIGEHEKEYDKMTARYPNSVLSACDDDVNKAFKYWMGMLQEMQVFASRTNFELKGAKFWLNTFFAPDGQIDYMVYYLKPSSRNIPEKEMRFFLSEFMKQYKLPLTNKSGFAHYGHVSFAILPENISN